MNRRLVVAMGLVSLAYIWVPTIAADDARNASGFKLDNVKIYDSATSKTPMAVVSAKSLGASIVILDENNASYKLFIKTSAGLCAAKGCWVSERNVFYDRSTSGRKCKRTLNGSLVRGAVNCIP